MVATFFRRHCPQAPDPGQLPVNIYFNFEGEYGQGTSQFMTGPLPGLNIHVMDNKSIKQGNEGRERIRDAGKPASFTFDDLAHRIAPVAKWEDLVLPPKQVSVLKEIALQVTQRVKETEPVPGAMSSPGLSHIALFTGESGTGKTMAAEVLAKELQLDLYRVDLGRVVSKYIGETEKNLDTLFDAAEHGGMILFFDEADALFGKRSEVKDSHDRYANNEVGYLLQKMEAYRGLAILATNMKSALDQAFLRRIRFVVSFPRNRNRVKTSSSTEEPK